MTLNEFAERYVAVWNEPDPKLRREAIEQLWAGTGTQILQPPQEIRSAADRLGMRPPALVASGHDEIESRVTAAYELFVGSGQMEFRAGEPAQRLEQVVKIRWIGVPPGGGQRLGGGTDILMLDEDGRIQTQYQFVDG